MGGEFRRGEANGKLQTSRGRKAQVPNPNKIPMRKMGKSGAASGTKADAQVHRRDAIDAETERANETTDAHGWTRIRNEEETRIARIFTNRRCCDCLTKERGEYRV
jgi:hypothetical protein